MLDWISYTASYTGDDGLEKYPSHEMWKRGEEVAAMHGYSRAWRLECGGFCMAPTKSNARQRILFIFGGEAMRKLRESGSTDESIIRYIFDSHYRPQFTRIDCAYDTDDENANAFDLLSAWRDGEVKTHIRTVRTHSTEKRDAKKPANTVYFGSVSSGRTIVIYDKAAELKLLDTALTRVELRNKKAFAQVVAHAGLTNSLDEVGRQVVRDMIKTEVLWFEDMMNGNTVNIDQVGRKETGGLMKWLKTQVAAGIENGFSENDPELTARIHQWATIVAIQAHNRLVSMVEVENNEEEEY